jgi:hypothetical protein
MHTMMNGFSAYPQRPSTLSPQFGILAMDSPLSVAQDAMVWDSQSPLAARDSGTQYTYAGSQQESGSCCQPATPTVPTLGVSSPQQQHQEMIGQAVPLTSPLPTPQLYSNEHIAAATTAQMQQTTPAFDFQRLQTDYFNYQFPSAICQNCGLYGCSCRNCPPVFQNFGTTSWAQYCGRKHAREAPPPPTLPVIAPKIAPPQQTWMADQVVPSMQADQPIVHDGFIQSPPFPLPDQNFQLDFSDLNMVPPVDPLAFDSFVLGSELLLPAGADSLNLDEYLLSDLNNTSHDAMEVVNEVKPDDDQSGGGGGCCCGG